MRHDPYRKYVKKATPDTKKGRLNFQYTLDEKAIKDDLERAASAKRTGTRILALAGGRSPLQLAERAIAGEIVGKSKELIKESFYRGFTEEIRTLSSGHPFR